MKKIVSLFTVLFFLAAILVTGCKKEEFVSTQSSAANTEENSDLSSIDKEMKVKLQQTAVVLKSVLNEADVVKELHNVAKSNVFQDENIPFEYLFNQKKSAELEKKGFSISTKFVEKFRLAEKSLLKSSQSSLEEYLVKNNCELYFPYSPEWDKREFNEITIAPHPIDNSYEGQGEIISFDHKKSAGSVLVNDEYAYNNDVVIIKPIIIHLDPVITQPDSTKSYFEPKTDSAYNYDNYSYNFKIEYAAHDGNMDPLYAGGSEFYFEMPNAYFDYSAASASDLVKYKLERHYFVIDRWALRKNVFRYVNCQFKSNWSPSETHLDVKFYEKDQTANTLDYKLGAVVQNKKKISVTLSKGNTVSVDKDAKFYGEVKGKMQKHDQFMDLGAHQRSSFIGKILYGDGEGKHEGRNIIRIGGSKLRVTFRVTAYRLNKYEI